MKASKMARNLTKRDDTSWIVPSETDPEANYVVKLVNDTCDCKLRCSICAVCIHTFSCTCMDSTIHATVCKHVHLVKLITEQKVKKQAEHTTLESLEYFSSLFPEAHNGDELKELRQGLLKKLDKLKSLVQDCVHIDAIKSAMKHLTSSEMIIVSLQDKQAAKKLPVKRKIPPNKNAEKQLRFFSTKRVKSRGSLKQNKPSLMEVKASKEELKVSDTTCCGVCFKENDERGEDLVDWVQCCYCDLWVHATCAKDSIQNDGTLDYRCTLCSED